MRPPVLGVQLNRVTNRRLLPTSRLHQLNLHRHRQRRIKILTVKRLPDLVHRDLGRGRCRRSLRIRDRETVLSITRHDRGETFNLKLLNRVGDVNLLAIDALGQRQTCERMCPVVPSVQLYRVTDRGCLPVNGLHQLNLHRHRGVRIKRITLSVLPHLVHRDFGRRRCGLRIRDCETTLHITRDSRGKTFNLKLLNRVGDANLLTVHKLPLRQILERMRPAVLGAQLNWLTNRGLLPGNGLHQLNLDRSRQRRIEILAIERLPDLVHRDFGRRRRGLRIRDRETTRRITRHSRGEALNSQLLNGVVDLGLLAVNGFGGRQICERVCPCVLGV